MEIDDELSLNHNDDYIAKPTNSTGLMQKNLNGLAIPNTSKVGQPANTNPTHSKNSSGDFQISEINKTPKQVLRLNSNSHFKLQNLDSAKNSSAPSYPLAFQNPEKSVFTDPSLLTQIQNPSQSKTFLPPPPLLPNSSQHAGIKNPQNSSSNPEPQPKPKIEQQSPQIFPIPQNIPKLPDQPSLMIPKSPNIPIIPIIPNIPNIPNLPKAINNPSPQNFAGLKVEAKEIDFSILNKEKNNFDKFNMKAQDDAKGIKVNFEIPKNAPAVSIAIGNNFKQEALDAGGNQIGKKNESNSNSFKLSSPLIINNPSGLAPPNLLNPEIKVNLKSGQNIENQGSNINEKNSLNQKPVIEGPANQKPFMIPPSQHNPSTDYVNIPKPNIPTINKQLLKPEALSNPIAKNTQKLIQESKNFEVEQKASSVQVLKIHDNPSIKKNSANLDCVHQESLKLQKPIPKNLMPNTLVKFMPDELIQVLDLIIKHLQQILSFNDIKAKIHEFNLKLNDIKSQKLIQAIEIHEFIINRFVCAKCAERSVELLCELRCGDIVCMGCLEEAALKTEGIKELLCPSCSICLDCFDEARIWKMLSFNKSDLENHYLRNVYESRKLLKCKCCEKEKKNYYNTCYHFCKECFASSLRQRVNPCINCEKDFDPDVLYNELATCDSCKENFYFVGTYGKYICDEKYLFCLNCTYDLYNSGYNKVFNHKMKKLEKIEINEHLFGFCNLCNKEVFKDYLHEKSDGYFICNEHEDEIC